MKIAIVNDMVMATEIMRRVIMSSSKHEVAWVAHDGADAVRRCQSNRPDLVLMDLIMPGMDGVETTRQIMATNPCAILLVTAVAEGNSGKVFEAMGAGALDVVQTPTLGGNGAGQGVARFLYKIDSTLNLVREPLETPNPSPRSKERARCLVAVGASAGGPAALVNLLSGLPEDLPAAIAIVQHVDAQFAPGLARWLGDVCKLPVRLAMEGDIPEEGSVLIAGANDHLILRPGGILGYTPEPVNCSYRPSVNVFFESVLQNWAGKLIGVLLTGMGRDGATGLKQIQVAGHHTIAQDRETSAVYGMPKAAADLGAALEILPLKKIAPAIVRNVRSHINT